MQRFFIFISSGILFILISIALDIIAISQGYKFKILMFALSIPFLFTGIWNIYLVYYEKKTYTSNKFFTFKPRGQFSWGVGAFYNKKIIVPVFIILFGCVVLAIVSGFLIAKYDEIALILTIVSFIYALTVTIYFLFRFNRELNTVLISGNDVGEKSEEQNSGDEIAVKIAFFFATVATFGLFALGYYVYKKFR